MNFISKKFFVVVDGLFLYGVEEGLGTGQIHEVVVAGLVVAGYVELVLLVDAEQLAVIDFAHEFAEDRQGCACALTEGHAAEVDVSKCL